MTASINYNQYNFSFNTTDLSLYFPDRRLVRTLRVTQIGIGFLAMVFNLFLLLVLYRNPLKRFRNPGGIFIASLAVADTLTVTSLWTSRLVSLVFPRPSSLVQKFFSSALTIGSQSSFFAVTTLTFERLFAVAFPFRYKVAMTRRRACYTILLLWVVACAVEPLLYFVPASEGPWPQVYAGEIIALCFLALLVYPIMLWKFFHEEKHMMSHVSSRGKVGKRLDSKRRLTVTVMLIIVAMVIFMVPYLASSVFTWSGCNRCILSPFYQKVVSVYYPVIYVTYFAVNPLIYAWKLPVYRRSLVVVLCGWRGGSSSLFSNKTQSLAKNKTQSLSTNPPNKGSPSQNIHEMVHRPRTSATI